MSEKKKDITLVILIILLVVLFVVNTILCISFARQQNEMIKYYNEKILILQEELNK